MSAPSVVGQPATGGAHTSATREYHDPERAALAWRLARRALALALADPDGLGGVVLHGRHGPSRDALLAELGRQGPVRRLPPDADDEALVGGLDTTATLAAARPVHRTGLLERARGETLLLGGAERLATSVATRLCAWLDGTPATGSDGIGGRAPLVALDESLEASGLVESALGERLALHVAVPDLALAELGAVSAPSGAGPGLGLAASSSAPSAPSAAATPDAVALSDEHVDGLVRLAARLGIVSLRAPLQACRAARVNAWLDGRDAVSDEDAALAAQLVLAPRARTLPDEGSDTDEPTGEPPPPEDEPAPPDVPDASDDRPEEPPPPAPDADDPPSADARDRDAAPTAEATDPLVDRPLPERLVDAVAAALPRDLLAALAAGRAARGADAGRDGGAQAAAERSGRPIGTRRARGGGRDRPNLLATLKAAVPHQRLRAIEAGDVGAAGDAPRRLRVRRDDLRVTRYRRPTRTTTLFLVDASGSSAMHRLAEAKGAVESLLAECYVRRDRVALATFRGTEATLDLPPTRSLVRARRALVGLPGGGGTPLAAGLDLAATQLERLVRDGESPVGVVMTDGRANVARDGAGSRPRARDDAELAARRLARIGARLLFVDTGPRPRPEPRRLAELMGARYLPLPQLDGALLGTGSRER